MIGRLLNISQVADFLQVSVRTVYRMIEDGEFPQGHIIRGSQRWYFNEIEEAVRFGPHASSDSKRMSNSVK